MKERSKAQLWATITSGLSPENIMCFKSSGVQTGAWATSACDVMHGHCFGRNAVKWSIEDRGRWKLQLPALVFASTYQVNATQLDDLRWQREARGFNIDDAEDSHAQFPELQLWQVRAAKQTRIRLGAVNICKS